MFDQIIRLFKSSPAAETSSPPDRLPSTDATSLAEDPTSAGESCGIGDSDLMAGWRSTTIGGRQADVFHPGRGERPTKAVLFLHGHGKVMLSANVTYSRLLRTHNLAAVCPDGDRSWWLDVVCPDFHPEISPQNWLLNSVLPWIEGELSICPPHVALLGVSMGGQGVLQLAYRHASRFPVVAAISPAVDFHQLYGSGIALDRMFPDRESARQASVVLNLHPLAWPRYQFFCCDPADVDWFDGCARLGMKLSSSGILHQRDLETSNGGHGWSYFDHMADKAFSHIVQSFAALDAEQLSRKSPP